MAAGTTRVTVIGLGLMGSALANAFRSAGHEVTVWNRSPERAQPFEGRARIAATVADACAASDVVVVSLLNYDAADAVLRTADVERVMAGRTLVQLTTGTPQEARNTLQWATEHGAGHLDGAISGFPRTIGTDSCEVLYSGDAALFEVQRPVLAALGGASIFCGEAIGAAAALDLASLEFSYAQLAGLLHGAALCAAESVPLEQFFTIAGTPGQLLEFATRHDFAADRTPIDAASAAAAMARPRRYPRSVDATLTTHAAAITRIAAASRDAGVDGSLPTALHAVYGRAVTRGHGDHDLPALIEGFLPG
jgi:3-hydroxyisobutyrate dehydrogenase-like beta-hydroxyacid dehydrogenase